MLCDHMKGHIAHLQDGPAGDASAQLLDLGAGLVDVKGADDNHLGRADEVAHGDGDALDDVLAHGVHVVLELRADGHHGRLLRNGPLDEVCDRVMLVLRGALAAGGQCTACQGRGGS